MVAIRRKLFWQPFALLASILLIGVLGVSAQSTGSPIPLTIDQNVSGQLTDSADEVQYAITVVAPQSIEIQVLAITPGFMPTFQLLDPGNTVVFDSANADAKAIAQGSPNLASPGTYTLVVRSANNTAGQFLISLQLGASPAPPIPLIPGTPVSGSVDAQTMRQAYAFSGSATDVLLLTVHANDPAGGAVVTLSDAATGEKLSVNNTALIGVSYRFPATTRSYLLEITAISPHASQAFTICLATEGGSTPCPGETVVAATVMPTLIAGVATPTFAPVAINPGGACQVAAARDNSVNVRSGAGTGYPIIGSLPASVTGLVVGRLADNSWYQINLNGVLGWVSSSVVIPGGNCAGVAVVVLPTAAPISSVPTNPPSTSSTHTPTPVPPPVTGLNSNASPLHGEVTLSQDIEPDPYAVNINGSGGAVDFSYLKLTTQGFGDACQGFGSSVPDFRIHYGGLGGPGLLRIYFVYTNLNAHAVMLVNDPYGNFRCSIVSPGSNDPSIDIYDTDAVAGNYDVWIGSTNASQPISGTLYVTANINNHP